MLPQEGQQQTGNQERSELVFYAVQADCVE